jgi:hypothetical protein
MKYLLIGTGVILVLLQGACSDQRAIASYQGDGEIFAMPDGGILQGGGGCQVRFKRMRLDQPAHFRFRFSGLPGRKTEVFFAIEDSRTWEDKHLYEWYQRTASPAEKEKYKYVCYEDLKGTLAISLKQAKGKVVLQFEKPLSKLRWSRAGEGPWELYDEQTVDFTPDSRIEYILEIAINPDPILNDAEGYVLFRSGGHEGL